MEKNENEELLEQKPGRDSAGRYAENCKERGRRAGYRRTESLQWKIYTLESGGSVSVVYKLQSL
mgnify:CR=1 FL=1